MRGFCQFSSHVTKRHACHTICTFSPLDAPLQSAAPATTNTSHLLTPCWNVTKCHACHTKRAYMTFETSKSDHFCSIPHRHCQRTPLVVVLRTVVKPDPQSKTRTLRYAFWKNYLRTVCASGSGYASADREFCSLATQPDLSETQDMSSCLVKVFELYIISCSETFSNREARHVIPDNLGTLADREFCSLAAQPDLSETQDISSCLVKVFELYIISCSETFSNREARHVIPDNLGTLSTFCRRFFNYVFSTSLHREGEEAQKIEAKSHDHNKHN